MRWGLGMGRYCGFLAVEDYVLNLKSTPQAPFLNVCSLAGGLCSREPVEPLGVRA